MKKIRVGVFGAYRGTAMINYCKVAEDAEVVAICDQWEEAIKRHKAEHQGLNIAYYNNFDDFIKHDMDAVVIANYANEHAPYAIRAMKAGMHVYSELLPVQTMKEAVELVEAVEETGKIYAYGENACFLAGPYEMKRLYQEGKLGEIEYAEAEYGHNAESIWPSIAYGDKNHWRNKMYSTFYCTHSIGPIIHMCGLRPISVTGFEPPVYLDRKLRMGAKGSAFGIEMITLENGALVKSIHGDLSRDSSWFCAYGSKGRMETARNEADNGRNERVYTNFDDYPGGYETEKRENYLASEKMSKLSRMFGHGGSDFYIMQNFIDKINGKEDADVIDVYEALDMYFPGHFAYRSLLAGGIPMAIPNFRNKEEREKWRNDVSCTDERVAGEQVWPSHSKGNPEIDEDVYVRQKELWLKDLKAEKGYTVDAFTQGKITK